MELEQLICFGLSKTFALSSVKKEFQKAVSEPWRTTPPWKRYQEKLLQSLAVLEDHMEQAIKLAQFEKLSGFDDLYCIRYPNAKKNVRVIYTIYDDSIILLLAFLEKKDSDYQRAIENAKKRLKLLNSD